MDTNLRKKKKQEPIATRRRKTRREAGRETKRGTRRKTRRGNTWTEHFPKASTSDRRGDTGRPALQAPSSELLAHKISIAICFCALHPATCCDL